MPNNTKAIRFGLVLMFKIENSMVVETKKWGRVVKDNHK
jgi:hypothetical protein